MHLKLHQAKTAGTQYGDSTADAVRHFSKEIGQKVVQSIKDIEKDSVPRLMLLYQSRNHNKEKI